MTFKILPLEASRFSSLNGASDAELEAAGAVAYVADAKPGFPCRITLQDAEPGTRLFLINFEHLSVETPYRSSHAIFVSENAEAINPLPGEVPEMISSRMISVRAFDQTGMMLDAALIDGKDAATTCQHLLGLEGADMLNIHSGVRGCYLAKVVAA